MIQRMELIEMTERDEAMGEMINTIIDAIEKMESVDSWIYGKAFSAGAEFRTVQIIRMLQDMKGEDYNEEERDV